jgi:hypothetical protein
MRGVCVCKILHTLFHSQGQIYSTSYSIRTFDAQTDIVIEFLRIDEYEYYLRVLNMSFLSIPFYDCLLLHCKSIIARQSCPAVLPGSLTRQSCPAI